MAGSATQGASAPVSKEDRLAPFVQIAAFSQASSAEQLKRRVQAMYGRSDVFVATAEKSGALVYRVRVGPFQSTQSAKQFRQRLERDRTGSPIVISRSVLGKGQ